MFPVQGSMSPQTMDAISSRIGVFDAAHETGVDTTSVPGPTPETRMARRRADVHELTRRQFGLPTQGAIASSNSATFSPWPMKPENRVFLSGSRTDSRMCTFDK